METKREHSNLINIVILRHYLNNAFIYSLMYIKTCKIQMNLKMINEPENKEVKNIHPYVIYDFTTTFVIFLYQ